MKVTTEDPKEICKTLTISKASKNIKLPHKNLNIKTVRPWLVVS